MSRIRANWPLPALALCAAIFWLRAENTIDGSSLLLLVAMTALVAASIVIAALAARPHLPGWKWLLVSPLATAAITWLTLFVLRPFELYYYPAETITALIKLGYDTGDLSRTVAIGGLGCATWGAGFLIALRLMRSQEWTVPQLEPIRIRRRAAWVMIAVGGALAAALFFRQGGFTTLINSPGGLHENRGSGFYGQLGIWILAGVALYSFAAMLQDKGRLTDARLVLMVSAPISILSTFALGSRGLVVFGLMAAAVIYIRLRTPSTRTIAITVVAVVLLGGLFEFVGAIRSNGAEADLPTAVERTFHTPVTYYQTGDLSTFDDLVAIQILVPSSISWLHGESLLQIPAALAPRALWPGKPEPIDNLVTDYLDPGATAGTPITLQGELYWNFGIPAVAIGALLMGMFMAWWMKLLIRRDALSLMLYAVLYPSVFAFLTRAVGTMAANTFIGLVGVGVVVLAMGPARFQPLRRPMKRLGSRI